MKIAICAGVKTEPLAKALNQKIGSTGIDIIPVDFIEDIPNSFQLGEYFDRIVVLEQGWTRDYTDEDENSIRKRVNNFAEFIGTKNNPAIDCIFIASDNDMAVIPYQETPNIQTHCIVLLMEKPYSYQKMIFVIKTELNKFASNTIYAPTIEDEVKIEEQEPISDNNDYQISNDTEDDYEVSSETEDDFGIDISEYGSELGFEGGNDDFGDSINSDDGLFNSFDDSFGGQEDLDSWESAENGDWQTVNEDDSSSGGELQPVDEISGENDNDWQPVFDDTTDESLGGISEPIDSDNNNDFESSDTIDNPVDETPFEQDKPIERAAEKTKKGGLLSRLIGGTKTKQAQQENPVYDSSKEEEHTVEPIQETTAFDTGIFDEYDQDNSGDNAKIEQTSNSENEQFSDSDYTSEASARPVKPRKRVSVNETDQDQIKVLFDALATRGNSILVTGNGGCGTSTVAFNLANTLNSLGYNILLVDLDTKNKAQSYISKSSYDCLEPESASLMSAINSTSGINAHVAILKQGFHLLTMGMASDAVGIEKIIGADKLVRFINLSKTNHNFVIYDCPFETAVDFGKDFTYMADNLVITIDCSNWGISKAMLAMCNIEDEDITDAVFSRGQLLFNRYRGMKRLMGHKIKSVSDVGKIMDIKTADLLGEEPQYYFQNMHICGLIQEDNSFDSCWFEGTQYSDSSQGRGIFVDILKNILLYK